MAMTFGLSVSIVRTLSLTDVVDLVLAVDVGTVDVVLCGPLPATPTAVVHASLLAAAAATTRRIVDEQRRTVLTASPETNKSYASYQGFSVKVHYTDTGYGHVVQHHQRTSSQQFYSLLYNKFTTNGHKFVTSQHLDMSRCRALALRCGKFVVQQVVELL